MVLLEHYKMKISEVLENLNVSGYSLEGDPTTEEQFKQSLKNANTDEFGRASNN